MSENLMAHTPHPWTVEKCNHRMRVVRRIGEPGKPGFQYRKITPDWHEIKSSAKRGTAPSFYGWHAQDEANARLIAAAPDLLVQLKSLAVQVEALGLIVPPHVRSAIARAEGKEAA